MMNFMRKMQGKIVLAVLVALLPILLAQEAARPTKHKFISVVRERGVWWFVDPDGGRFLSKGVNVVLPVDSSARPGARGYNALRSGKSTGQWARETTAELSGWGFNTIGSWSDQAVFAGNIFTVFLGMRIENNKKLVDVFSREFEAKIEKIARELCANYRDDPLLLGYFLDNEQPWYGDVGWFTGHPSTVMDACLALPDGAEGRKRLVRFLGERYKSVEDFNRLFGTDYKKWDAVRELATTTVNNRALTELRDDFLAIVADRYYRLTTQKIRAVDPNHLVLGDRFANFAPAPVIRACAEHCDVVSLNYYLGYKHVGGGYLAGFAAGGAKPLLITEFSYRATENNSGLKNTKGADVTVLTQNDRAVHFEKYVCALCGLPFVVGYHWFQYFDEPPSGRSFDGEDSNYGLVDINGKAYATLVEKITSVNALSDAVHQRSGSGPPLAVFRFDDPVRVNGGKTRARDKTPYCLFTAAANNLWGWADTTHGAAAGSVIKEGSAVVSYRTGTGWGCGVSIAPNRPPLNADQSVDARGFRGIELTVRVPRRARYSVFVTESGADEAGKERYAGAGSADGESFTSLEAYGTGKTETINFEFQKLYLRLSYGNQAVDLSAIRAVDLYLPGNQGAGEISIESVSLY